ncbi:avidin-like [Aptenodytes patagonicus]|uniref:avidin-like n=1 Tax=Aptenodytes patagonicus TaxID=9234 RepID=UPI003FA01468
MVQAAPFLLVLSLALVAPGLSARKCVLTGHWINDLGSNMTITAVNGKGDFTRSYHMAMTASTNEVRVSLLQGSQHRMNQKSQPTFGFTINWSFSDSVTVFTGQCFVDKEGKEVLKTMWLLRSHMDSIKNNWKANRVGTNVFTHLHPQKERGWQRGPALVATARLQPPLL